MLFNSHEFIFIFLPITFIGYMYFLKKRWISSSKLLLVISSLFFYSWWEVSYLPIILCSLYFNYKVGCLLTSGVKNRKVYLAVGVSLNLVLLGYFKYTNFLISNTNYFFEAAIPSLEILLPLAISFFTFQQVAYLVDSYRGRVQEHDFLNYALFVTFFPQLIAGPIVHHREMMPQFQKVRDSEKHYMNILTGIFVFSIGIFKKVVIADSFSIWAKRGFDICESLSFVEAWATSLSYTFQIYFDFSGYTDMAIGIALLFNINLPVNFNSPYKSATIKEFWKRWHMTLSIFLRDYIYIPLGGSRRSVPKTYVNIMITFLLGGIWHGAGWTFIVWGAMHGLALVVHRVWKHLGLRMNFFLAWFMTFNFVNITWVFFRAKEWSDAVKVLKGMFVGELVFPRELQAYLGQGFSYGVYALGDMGQCLFFIVFSMVVVLLFRNSNTIKDDFRPTHIKSCYLAALLFMVLLSLNRQSEFLYFNF